MPTLAQVFAALEARLATIPGLTAYDVWTLAPTPPWAMPRFTGDSEAETFDGRASIRFELWVGVSPRDFPAAQRALYAYASRSGTSSILAKIEADPTLGGVVETTMVGGIPGPFESATMGDVEFLTMVRPVEVLVGP